MDKQWIFAMVGLVPVIFLVLFFNRKNHKALEQIEADAQRNAATVEDELAALKQMNILGDLVEDKSISILELRQKAEASLAIIESKNTRGNLTDFIKSSKEAIKDEIQARESAAKG